MPIIGYARASKGGAPLETQLAALRAAGAQRIVEDTAGRGASGRSALARALADLKPGDTLIVTRLDRLASSMRDLVVAIEAIGSAGANFRSLGEPWADGVGPAGRHLFAVLGGLAHFERDLVRSRTATGRARARARGAHMCRPATLTAAQQAQALGELAAGVAQADIARRFAVSQSTISRLAGRQAPTVAPRSLDPETERAVRAFLRRLDGRYPVREAIVYGSRARGDHAPDSDADLAVVLRGPPGDRAAAVRDMAALAFHVMMETGVMVEAMPLWEDELDHPERFSNPALIGNVLREGVRL